MADAGQESGEAFVGPILAAVDDPETGVAPSLIASIKAAEADPELAKAAEDAAKKAMEAFWDTAEAETASRAKTSAFGFRTPETLAAIRQGATDAGLEWSTSFMHETDGLVNEIGDTMTLTDEGWVLAGAHGGEKLTDAVEEETSTWASGGGMNRMFTGMTGAVTAFASGGWKSGILSMANEAMSYLPPGMAQVAQASLAAARGGVEGDQAAV